MSFHQASVQDSMREARQAAAEYRFAAAVRRRPRRRPGPWRRVVGWWSTPSVPDVVVPASVTGYPVSRLGAR